MNKQELIKALDDLEVFDMSYYNGDMKHLPRKNFYINKYKALSLIERLGDTPEGYEKLSEEWIEKNKKIMMGITTLMNMEYINVKDLQNLLIPKQENDIFATDTNVGHQVRKVTIPQFVADWIEDNEAKENSMCRLMTYESIKLYCPHEMYLWLFESGSNDNIEKMARAWLDGYEVEQEKLYTVTFEGGLKLAVWTIGNDICLYNDDVPYNYRFELTKSEIESVEPILMQIAKPVGKGK